MAVIADYPDGIATAGPTIARLITQPVDYEVDVIKYEDGGADVNVTPCGVERFILEYDGMSEVDLATLRTHYNLAKGRTNNFEFYHRQASQTYSGVEYESFRVSEHPKAWLQPLTVVLIRYI
jgi:hypothetical protein